MQQCILQVLEPVCEAKFFKHSYGFRPLRSAKHAIARAYFLAQVAHLHYVVDIDIKGFFDNIDHGKLLKQLWTLGIEDKSLLRVISKMLKAEIDGIGVPAKGTPQRPRARFRARSFWRRFRPRQTRRNHARRSRLSRPRPFAPRPAGAARAPSDCGKSPFHARCC